MSQHAECRALYSGLDTNSFLRRTVHLSGHKKKISKMSRATSAGRRMVGESGLRALHFNTTHLHSISSSDFSRPTKYPVFPGLSVNRRGPGVRHRILGLVIDITFWGKLVFLARGGYLIRTVSSSRQICIMGPSFGGTDDGVWSLILASFMSDLERAMVDLHLRKYLAPLLRPWGSRSRQENA